MNPTTTQGLSNESYKLLQMAYKRMYPSQVSFANSNGLPLATLPNGKPYNPTPKPMCLETSKTLKRTKTPNCSSSSHSESLARRRAEKLAANFLKEYNRLNLKVIANSVKNNNNNNNGKPKKRKCPNSKSK